MRTSAALILALLTSVALPAGAQPAANTPEAAAQVAAAQDGSTREFTVDKADGLKDAVAKAVDALKADEVKEAVIKITTCDKQAFPEVIDAQGKITIIGCGDKPAGVKPEENVSRTPLQVGSHSTIRVSSPLELRGVSIKGYALTLFEAYNNVSIANSEFEGTTGVLSNSLLLKVAPSDRVQDPVFSIQDSKITNSAVVNTSGKGSMLTLKNNVISGTPSSTSRVIGIDYTTHYNPDGSKPVLIENNEFKLNARATYTSVIRVSRGDVKIHNNRFALSNPSASFSTVQLFQAKDHQGKALANVAITYNQFDGGTAIANNSGDEIAAGVLTIANNDFSKAKAVLPLKTALTNPLSSVTPKANVVADDNFWGSLDTTKVEATITKKKDAYTPPVDPNQPPGKPDQPGQPGDPDKPGTPDQPKPPVDPGNPGNPDNPGQPQPPVPPVVPPVVPPPVSPPVAPQPTPDAKPSSDPSMAPSAPRSAQRLAGETRYETAGKVAQDAFKTEASAVILARGDVHADSVSAVPLAEELNAPILLTQTDTLHPVAATEIKRLMPKGGKVYVMGGHAAVSKAVEDEVTKLGGQVVRVAGSNRAATAVETANQLKSMGKAKHFLVADGGDWQADLIAGPAAAAADGATLLTNGDKIAPETEAFLKANASAKTFAVGAGAAKALPSAEALSGSDATALSLAVAKRFFAEPKAAGVATTVDFADALAGGAQVAEVGGPILLIADAVPTTVTEYLNAQKNLTKVLVYGGEQRISSAQMEALSK